MLGGIYSHFGKPDGKAQKGTFTVKIADTASPVTQGLKDFTLKDELYTNMQMMPDVRPLATIEYQGVVWPVAWTTTFRQGPGLPHIARAPRLRSRQGRPSPRSESRTS